MLSLCSLGTLVLEETDLWCLALILCGVGTSTSSFPVRSFCAQLTLNCKYKKLMIPGQLFHGYSKCLTNKRDVCLALENPPWVFGVEAKYFLLACRALELGSRTNPKD